MLTAATCHHTFAHPTSCPLYSACCFSRPLCPHSLATQLSLLQENASRNAKERDAMRSYCDTMSQSSDSQSEMLVALRSQNVMLARKLKALEDRTSVRRKSRKPLPQPPQQKLQMQQQQRGGSHDAVAGSPVSSAPTTTDGATAAAASNALGSSHGAHGAHKDSADVQALREQVQLLSEERNQLLRECAQLRAAAQQKPNVVRVVLLCCV